MRWLPIVLCAAAIEAQTVPAQPGSIDGRVTNSITGDLVPGAAIRLLPLHYAGEHASEPQANSQSDGSFHLDSVPPGSYIVIAERDGFVLGQPDSRPPFVNVQPGQFISGLTVQITPEGSMTGKVVDEDGKPVAEADVRAISNVGRSSRQSARTDSAGVFKLPKLAPGSYYLLADPPVKTQAGFVRTIYPHSLNFDEATTIQVSAGQTASDTTIRLRRAATYHIRGKISEPPDGASSQRFRITITPRVAIDARSLTKDVRVNPDQTFEVDGLVSGGYTLRLMGQSSKAGRQRRLLSRQEVDIGTTNVDDLILQITPPLTLAGHVVAESPTPVNFSGGRIMAVPVEDLSRGTQVFTTVAADGSFTLTDLDPGVYRIRALFGLRGMYLKSISLNQQDVMNKDVDLSQTGPGQLEIVMRSGTAEVDGTAQPADSPAMIVLAPEIVGPEGWSGVRFGYTRQGGAFVIADLPPGRYTAYAADRFAVGLWQNAGFLREMANLGKSIELDENGRQQVELQKIPVELIQQTAARLGLPVQ